ncbi:MAG: bacteriohemerythrin [Candidatus Thiodiazotropha sp.]|jgi:hemerythrin
MSFMVWTEEGYGTTVAACDAQHQELFNRVNALNTAVSDGGRPEIGNRLDSLIDYVVEHFTDEERLMEEKGYEDLPNHRKVHADLVNTCTDLQKKFHANEAEVDSSVMKFIKDWLDNHIPIVDRQYGPVLSS